jgi:hypothetical protein
LRIAPSFSVDLTYRLRPPKQPVGSLFLPREPTQSSLYYQYKPKTMKMSIKSARSLPDGSQQHSRVALHISSRPATLNPLEKNACIEPVALLYYSCGVSACKDEPGWWTQPTIVRRHSTPGGVSGGPEVGGSPAFFCQGLGPRTAELFTGEGCCLRRGSRPRSRFADPSPALSSLLSIVPTRSPRLCT